MTKMKRKQVLVSFNSSLKDTVVAVYVVAEPNLSIPH